MEWTRSNTIGLAKATCVHCEGLGLRTPGSRASRTDGPDQGLPCNCVYRAIFRAVYQRFKDCAASQGHAGTVNIEHCGSGVSSRRTYSRKTEDFMADFLLVSQRSLNDAEHKLFRYAFLLDADWQGCCAVLKMERGNFFHARYDVEQKLGRIFATLKPYALYPLDDYFGTVVTRSAA